MLSAQINGVKDYIDGYGEESDDEGAEEDLDDNNSPTLLLGMSRPITKEELLVDIPPREIADRLVSRFLKTTEPSLSECFSCSPLLHDQN